MKLTTILPLKGSIHLVFVSQGNFLMNKAKYGSRNLALLMEKFQCDTKTGCTVHTSLQREIGSVFHVLSSPINMMIGYYKSEHCQIVHNSEKHFRHSVVHYICSN